MYGPGTIEKAEVFCEHIKNVFFASKLSTEEENEITDFLDVSNGYNTA